MTVNKILPASTICDRLISNAADKTLDIGPLTWQPSDGTLRQPENPRTLSC